NILFAKEFGHVEPMLPLKDAATLVQGNSLRLNWNDVCPNNGAAEVYLCGNPPFVGYGSQSHEQHKDIDVVLDRFQKTGRIDYVSCWFWKGSEYIKHQGELSFVSTSSICQGLQVAMLWPNILDLGVSIDFAYQSFNWKNSAKENAGVHVVIIGLCACQRERRLYQLFEGKWRVREVENISPYLLEGDNAIVESRKKPIVGSPKMILGNMSKDGGHLLLTPEEKKQFIEDDPKTEVWIKRLMGAKEFLQGHERWCLWLADATKQDVDSMPSVRDRVERVRETRLASKDAGTQKLAERPHQLRETHNPESFILVPRVTSSRRYYVPLGFFGDETIVTDLVQIIPDGTLYDFAVLSTQMHMDWLRLVGGRLKSDYRYSATLVYNTFPWPEVSDSQREQIEQLGRAVILARAAHPDKTMSQLYDPDKMPENLLEAHQALDRAVEKLYRDRPFRDTAERQEYLLARYEELIEAEKAAKVGGSRKSRSAATMEG
ncbi:MAG: class I SAM-dependent DNA methyltransferase, partial [Pseudomonadota bacterium]